jgi:hypothetical protein
VRFAAGDSVLVKLDDPPHHTRVPRYVRGRRVWWPSIRATTGRPVFSALRRPRCHTPASDHGLLEGKRAQP